MSNRGGQPGNNNPRKLKPFYEQLMKIIKQEELTLPEKQRRFYKAANKLLKLAGEGDRECLKMLADRVDGKAVQGVELSDPEGNSLNFFDPANLRNLSTNEAIQLRQLLNKAATE